MRKYYLLLVILIIVLTIILSVWFDAWVNRVLVQPVAYLVFISRLVIGSFHQGVIWVSFIVTAILIALMILIPQLPPTPKPEDEEWDYPDRVHIWERHIWAMNEGEYLRISLEDHIADLIVEAISFREGIREDAIVQYFRTGDLEVPSEIHRLLLAGYQPSALDEKERHIYSPDEIIQFLESQLQVFD